MAAEQNPGAQPLPAECIDADLARDIKDLLAINREVNLANVEVHVNHGVATLRGIVTSAAARDMAERTARSVPGVADVVSELRVFGTGQG